MRAPTHGFARWWRLAAVLLLGFASGLPLALTGQAMQAWLSMANVDMATIGFLSLVGLPYTFKFLWAPLMDRFELPVLGRRRGWVVVTQLGLAAALYAMASVSPAGATRVFACVAVLVAFLSASQDVVIDAYRTDVLPARDRGLGASLAVLGYRLAMVLSGGVALIWTDASHPGALGWSWPHVYRFMAGLMLATAGLSAVGLPRLGAVTVPRSSGWRDVLGFVAVLAAVGLGVALTQRFGRMAADFLLAPILDRGVFDAGLRDKWLDLAALLLGIVWTTPLAVWAARRARFDTLLGGLRNYFEQPGAWGFLAFIVLYKLGDAFAGSLLTPFLLRAMAYSSAQVGLVNKILGLWLTIAGALVGGALMVRLKLWRSLLVFGVLQMFSNLGFWWLARAGQGALPGIIVPAFDWGFVRLAAPTSIDGGLLLAVAMENVASGMGSAALVAFLMSLCNRRFTATQFALLSAFASIGRVWVGPVAGVLSETVGWPAFFVIAMLSALPGLMLLLLLRKEVVALENAAVE